MGWGDLGRVLGGGGLENGGKWGGGGGRVWFEG